jgi:hypothetical protein
MIGRGFFDFEDPAKRSQSMSGKQVWGFPLLFSRFDSLLVWDFVLIISLLLLSRVNQVVTGVFQAVRIVEKGLAMTGE